MGEVGEGVFQPQAGAVGGALGEEAHRRLQECAQSPLLSTLLQHGGFSGAGPATLGPGAHAGKECSGTLGLSWGSARVGGRKERRGADRGV